MNGPSMYATTNQVRHAKQGSSGRNEGLGTGEET